MEGMAPILHVANARASIEWYAKLGFEVESEHSFGRASDSRTSRTSRTSRPSRRPQ